MPSAPRKVRQTTLFFLVTFLVKIMTKWRIYGQIFHLLIGGHFVSLPPSRTGTSSHWPSILSFKFLSLKCAPVFRFPISSPGGELLCPRRNLPSLSHCSLSACQSVFMSTCILSKSLESPLFSSSCWASYQKTGNISSPEDTWESLVHLSPPLSCLSIH